MAGGESKFLYDLLPKPSEAKMRITATINYPGTGLISATAHFGTELVDTRNRAANRYVPRIENTNTRPAITEYLPRASLMNGTVETPPCI
jgi:hypothetical protein